MKLINSQGYFPTGKLSELFPDLKPNTRQKQFRTLIDVGFMSKVKTGYKLESYRCVWSLLGLYAKKVNACNGGEIYVTYKKIQANTYQEFKNILYNHSIEHKFNQVRFREYPIKGGQKRPVKIPTFLRMSFESIGEYLGVSTIEAWRIMQDINKDSIYGLEIRPVILTICKMSAFDAKKYFKALYKSGNYKGEIYTIDGFIKRRGANEYEWHTEKGKKGATRKAKEGFKWYNAA